MQRQRRTLWIAILVALVTSLAGCFDLSGQEVEPTLFDSPLATPTAEPGVIVLTPGEDRIEPTWTPWPTTTPRPTPTRRPGPTATPFPTRGPAADASEKIYYAVNRNTSAPANSSGFHPGHIVYSLPVDASGRAKDVATPLPLPDDISLIFDSVSPDGRYMLILRPSEPGGVPYIYDLSDGQLRPLFQEYLWAGGRSFGWHPNSHQMLFWALDAAMWLVDVETENYTILSYPDGPVQGATMSPDGQRVVFLATGYPGDYVAIVSTAGSDQRALIEPVDAGGIRTIFSWSPDGQHILYAGAEETGSKGSEPSGGPLFLMDTDGQNRRPLQGPFIYGWGFEPVWAPDGRRVAYVGSNPGETFGCVQKDEPIEGTDTLACYFVGTSIYVEDVSTGETVKLVNGIAPAWSPDGSRIAFLSDQSGTSEVWVVNVQDGSSHQITANGQPKAYNLVWSMETGEE